MKKNIIVAALAAASALLLAASCQKQELVEQNNGNAEGKTFTASISQNLTKTTITSAYKVNWDQGDLIDINGGTTYSATPDASDATKATFTKVSGLDQKPDYTAVYPASLFKNSGYQLPATQTYAAGKFNAPMCAMSSTESLEFKNFCGVLCFALKGTDKVKSIAVTAKEQICGPFEFADATSFSFSGENVGYTVTLNCGEGVQLDASTATSFYISLPPATYTAGMKIVVTSTEGKTFEKTTTKSAAIARNQIYTFNWTASFSPAGALKGEFSVSATKKVHFSQGNLVATINASGTPTAWKFSTHQYDCLGAGGANKTIGSAAGDVDLFGWSTSTNGGTSTADNYGIKTSTMGSFYPGDFYDWGKAVGDGNTWRTLSKDEWTYLFNNHSKKWATVNGVKGYVIAPDGFDGTLSDTYADDAALAANNLVFLPAAGARSGSSVSSVGINSCYWSSTALDETYAYVVYFNSSDVDPDYAPCRADGSSVRLVTEVPTE